MQAPRLLPIAVILLATLPTSLTSCTLSHLMQQQENGLAVLNASLATVHDRDTADAAAPAVRRYGAQLAADLKTLYENGRPTFLQLLMLRESYQSSNISQEARTSLDHLVRICSSGFYGSTALSDAIFQVILDQTTTSFDTSHSNPQRLLRDTQRLLNLRD